MPRGALAGFEDLRADNRDEAEIDIWKAMSDLLEYDRLGRGTK